MRVCVWRQHANWCMILEIDTSLCVIKIATEVVTLLIIYQIRSCLGGSEGNVGAFEEHKQ